jgi:hypothetical protein
VDDRVDRPLQLVDVPTQALGHVPILDELGVELERRHRCA